MRVNAVIMSTMPGSKVTAVIRIRICSVSEYSCPPFGAVVTVTAGMPAADARPGHNIGANVSTPNRRPSRCPLSVVRCPSELARAFHAFARPTVD